MNAYFELVVGQCCREKDWGAGGCGGDGGGGDGSGSGGIGSEGIWGGSFGGGDSGGGVMEVRGRWWW